MLDELIDKVIDHIRRRKDKQRKQEDLREGWLEDARLTAQDSGYGMIDANDAKILKVLADGTIIISARATGSERTLSDSEWSNYVRCGLEAVDL